MNDKVGNADMKQGPTRVFFGKDRFGNLNEALKMQAVNSYTYVQPGYYFTTPQFSISLWVFSNDYYYHGPNNYPIFGFGINDYNNIANNDIIFYLGSNNIFSPSLQIWNSSSIVVDCQSSNNLLQDYLNKWLHLVATYDGVTANIYMNVLR